METTKMIGDYYPGQLSYLGQNRKANQHTEEKEMHVCRKCGVEFERTITSARELCGLCWKEGNTETRKKAAAGLVLIKSEILQEYMDRRGRNTTRIAGLIGVKPRAVSDWLKGGRARMSSVMKLAALMGVDGEKLIQEESK